MEYITLNKNGFAEVSGFVKCYCVDPNGEYIGPVDEYIPATAGLPAGAFMDEPPADEEGKAIIRISNKWWLVDDHRGETVYSTENGQQVEVKALGDYPDNTTPLAPSTQYDVWNGIEWITDAAAQKSGQIAEAEQQRQILIAQANAFINIKQWPGKAAIGRLKGTELAQYNVWLDYLDALDAIDTSSAPDVSWPQKPAA